MSDLPKLLTARQVADSTGLSLHRVYELARTRRMPVIHLGRSMRFDPEAVASWLKSGGTSGREGT